MVENCIGRVVAEVKPDATMLPIVTVVIWVSLSVTKIVESSVVLAKVSVVESMQ